MKIKLGLLLAVLPVTASAVDFQGMGGADMQKMMQEMGRMQQCMSQISQKEMDALSARSETSIDSIKSLCEQGKRDKAEAESMIFARKMASDPTILKMQKCGDMATEMLRDMPGMPADDQGDEGKAAHVCDTIDD